jgi:hypothetical protein
MSHSGRRALAETAATLSGGSSCNKHGKDKKKTSKKSGAKPKPTTSTKKRGGGGGYGHGHKQKGGNCGPYEFTHEQANVLFVASEMNPALTGLNSKVIEAIMNSLAQQGENRKVKISITDTEKSDLHTIVFSKQIQNLASIVQEIRNTNAMFNADQRSVMNQLEIRLNRYNFMKNLKDEHLKQLQKELDGLKSQLNTCPSPPSTTPTPPNTPTTPTTQHHSNASGEKKNSFLKKDKKN